MADQTTITRKVPVHLSIRRQPCDNTDEKLHLRSTALEKTLQFYSYLYTLLVTMAYEKLTLLILHNNHMVDKPPTTFNPLFDDRNTFVWIAHWDVGYMDNLFRDFSDRYGQLFTLHPDFFTRHGVYGLVKLVESAATEVRTAFTNHIKLNFITRMRNGLIRVWLRRNGHRDNKRIREMLSDLICGGWKRSYRNLIDSNDLGEYRWEGAGQVPIDSDTNDLSILELFVFSEHRILRTSQCDESVQFRIYREWDGEPDYSWMDRNMGVCLVATIRYLHEVESFNESVDNGVIQANKVKQWSIVPMASETLHPFPIDEQTVLLVAMDSGIISTPSEFRVNYTDRRGNVTNQALGLKNSKSTGFGRLFMNQMFYMDPKEALRQRKVDVAAGRQISLPLPGDAVPFTTSRNRSVDGLLGVPDISGLETVIVPGTRPGHVLVNGVEHRVRSLAEEPTAPISARETPRHYITTDGVTLNILFEVREREVEREVESDKEDADDEENETAGVGPVFSMQERKYHERKIAKRATVQVLRQDPPVENESPEERLEREKRNKKRRYRRNKAIRRIQQAQNTIALIASNPDSIVKEIEEGVDPGQKAIVTMQSACKTERGRRFLRIANTLTKGQFDHETGKKRSEHLTTKWRNRAGLETAEQIKSIYHPKTARLDWYLMYLAHQYSFVPGEHRTSFGCGGNFALVSAEKMKTKWSKLKYNKYRLTERCYASFFHRVYTNADKIVQMYCTRNPNLPMITDVRISYGGANFSSTVGRPDGGVPAKAFRRRCKHYFQTRIVNENMTSQICFQCNARLHKPLNRTFTEYGTKREIGGIRICMSCKNSRIKALRRRAIVSRDGNAAMNMIRANAAGDEVLGIFRTRRGEPQGTVEWDFFPNTKRQARVEEENLERQTRMEFA